MRRIVGLVCLVAVAAACGGAHPKPGLKHARAACAHWTKINAGIADVAQRQAESTQFTTEATAAAAADVRYNNLKQAAESWQLVQTGPLAITDVSGFQEAITAARTACAGVPTK